jgi:hypothetical protein
MMAFGMDPKGNEAGNDSMADLLFNISKEAYEMGKNPFDIKDPVKGEALKAVEQFKIQASKGNLNTVKKVIKENDQNMFFKIVYSEIIRGFAKASPNEKIAQFTESWLKNEIKREDIKIDEK